MPSKVHYFYFADIAFPPHYQQHILKADYFFFLYLYAL